MCGGTRPKYELPIFLQNTVILQHHNCTLCRFLSPHGCPTNQPHRPNQEYYENANYQPTQDFHSTHTQFIIHKLRVLVSRQEAFFGRFSRANKGMDSRMRPDDHPLPKIPLYLNQDELSECVYASLPKTLAACKCNRPSYRCYP